MGSLCLGRPFFTALGLSQVGELEEKHLAWSLHLLLPTLPLSSYFTGCTRKQTDMWISRWANVEPITWSMNQTYTPVLLQQDILPMEVLVPWGRRQRVLWALIVFAKGL